MTKKLLKTFKIHRKEMDDALKEKARPQAQALLKDILKHYREENRKLKATNNQLKFELKAKEQERALKSIANYNLRRGLREISTKAQKYLKVNA